jgi:hypothetical protein
MSIEEIATNLSNDAMKRAWTALVTASRLECEKLDAILGSGKTFKIASESAFTLQRGNVVVIVKQNAADIAWTRIEEGEPGTVPRKDTGSYDVRPSGELKMHGFGIAPSDAALVLIDLLRPGAMGGA